MSTADPRPISEYIKKLEETIKNYYFLLTQKDKEISNLRQKLSELQNSPPHEKILSCATPDFPPTEPLAFQGNENETAEDIEINNSKPDESTLDVIQPQQISEENLPSAKVPDLQNHSLLEESPTYEPIPKSLLQDSAFSRSSSDFKSGFFLSAVLEGEEEADGVKEYLAALHQSKPEEKRPILLSLTDLYWQLVVKMGKRLVQNDLSWEKRLFIRYGMLDESLMDSRLEIWFQLYQDSSEPGDTGVYYLDEWLKTIGSGTLRTSRSDEIILNGKKSDPQTSGESISADEIHNIRQMQRMCVGPQANEVTILIQEYCNPGRENPIITRPGIKSMMDFILKRDYSLFQRKVQGEEFEFQPLILLCPGYGQRGGCWEIWNPGLKRKSGPRIYLSVFPPKSGIRALIMGLADYRWEYAKANAMHYWMTEGLTGKWLGLFSIKEQKKDLKGLFLENYYHWIVNESRMIPKLEKRFREFFWTQVPYSEEIQQTLKTSVLFSRLLELEEMKKKREDEP